MKTLGLTFLLIGLFLIQSYSQSVDLDSLTNESFARVLQDINKAKDIEDTLRVQLIAELNELITKVDLSREMVFGKNEEYLNKGMSGNFKSEPKSMKVEHDRDPNVIAIEDKHVELYTADYNLRVLESLEEHILDLKDSPQELEIDSSHNDAVIYSRIIQGTIKSIEKKYKKRLDAFDLSLDDQDELNEPQTSYPYDGQLNFYIDNYNSDYGYIVSTEFKHELTDHFNFKAKWTNKEGKTVYTDMYYRWLYQVMYMQIPKAFLEPNNLYHLEIVGFNINQIDHGHNVDRFYRYLINRNPNIITEQLEESKVYKSIYFRTSIHRTLEDKIKGDQNFYELNENSKVSIQLQEPFSKDEIKQENIQESLISFKDNLVTTSHDFVYNVAPYYYLYYPQYEVIDTNKFENKLISELDQTINAEYFRKINMKSIARINPDTMLEKFNSIGVTIPKTNDEAIELQVESFGPRITKEIFESKVLNLKPSKIDFGFPKIQAAINELTTLQEKVKERMEERAKFYQYADIVFSKRKGESERKKYEDYLRTEQENLPVELQELLEMEPQNFDSPYMYLNIDYFKPGFETAMSSHLMTILLK